MPKIHYLNLVDGIPFNNITILHLQPMVMTHIGHYPFHLMEAVVELSLQIKYTTLVAFGSYQEFNNNGYPPTPEPLLPLQISCFETRLIMFIRGFRRLRTLLVYFEECAGLLQCFDLYRVLSPLQSRIKNLAFNNVHFPITDPTKLVPYLSQLTSLRLCSYPDDSRELFSTWESDGSGGGTNYLDHFWNELHHKHIELSELFVIFPTLPFLSYVHSLTNLTHLAFFTIDSSEAASLFTKVCLPHIAPSIVSLEIVGSREMEDDLWHLSEDVCKKLLECKKLNYLSIPARHENNRNEAPIKVCLCFLIISFLIPLDHLDAFSSFAPSSLSTGNNLPAL